MPVKQAVFGLVALLIPSLLLLCTAELALRWHATGSPVRALQTFQPSAETWLVEDADLGFKLNPADESVSSLGIRHGELRPKTRDETRIVVIGDSVAWDRDGFVFLLRDRLEAGPGRRLEVVNAAIPGYTTYQERILLERDLLPLGFDLVLLQYCVNDNHQFLHRLDEGGQWIITPEALHGFTLLPRWLEASYLLNWVRWQVMAWSRAEREAHDVFPWRRTLEFGNAWRDETWPEQQRQIRAMRDAAALTQARLAIVAFPYEPQLQDRALARDTAYTLKPQRKLAEVADGLGLPFLDLHPAFLRSRDRRLFRDELHLSAAGHELAAAEISAFLEREGLLAAFAQK